VSKQELLDEILPEVIEECNRLAEHLSGLGRIPTIEEIEVAHRQMMRIFGGKLIEKVATLHHWGHTGRHLKCSCGAMAGFEGYREKTVVSMVGQAKVERAYYYCPSCRRGFAPMDESLGLSRRQLSRAVERSICRLAAVESFELASEDLYELSGVSVSAKETQLVSESVGKEMALQEASEVRAYFAQEIEIEPEDSPSVLVIGLDGKMVPTRSGHDRELKVVTVFDLVEPREKDRLSVGKTTYLGRFTEPDKLAEHVWVEAARRGVENAGAVIGLGDGAAWIWKLVSDQFPRAVQILDIFHAREHLWELGNALYGQGTEKTARFVNYKIKQVDEGRVDKVIAALSKLKATDATKAEMLREEIHYFTANRDRMDYPYYRKLGYHIGSGVVESGCKQFGARLDAVGMTWTEEGAGAIAALKAVKLSARWDSYWQPVRAPLCA
jgi:hypothetical protein